VKRFVASAAAVVILDQVTKFLARAQLGPGETTRLLGDVLYLHLVRNPGSAFSLVLGNRLLLIAISFISIALILYLALSRRHTFAGSFTAFGLILGGAVGNLIDRVGLREVTDFIDMGIGLHRWPTYNVADIGITLGVIYLGIGFLFLEPRRGAAGAPDERT
jgi:signal peptidase II